jgi:hypothetical protein
MSELGDCFLCGHGVNSPQQGYAYRIVAWEAVRHGSMPNRIIDRQRLGAIAHTLCVEQLSARRRRGIADDQESLMSREREC